MEGTVSSSVVETWTTRSQYICVTFVTAVFFKYLESSLMERGDRLQQRFLN